MTNRLMFQIIGVLLGAIGALAAALAFASGALWLSDQSSGFAGGITLPVAIAALLVAAGSIVARRAVARLLASERQADARSVS